MYQEPKKDEEKWYEKILKKGDIPWLDLTAILLLIMIVCIFQYLRGDLSWISL